MLESARSICDRPATVDVLTDLLQRSRARGALFSHTTAHGGWGVRFAAAPRLAVHAIVAGEAHLWADVPERALRLVAGDIALVRESLGHQLAHAPGAPCVPFFDVPGDPTGRRRLLDGDGPSTVFFCGAYDFEGALFRPLLDSLPAPLRLRPQSGSTLRATLHLLGREVLQDAPGQQALLDRLLDVALVQLLREHLTAADTPAPAWFRASSDPHVGAALGALHADPARRWTVTDLAAEANLSRSAFARRFSALLDVGPLEYLTEWRMALARERLRHSDDRLAAIAHSLGYRSEFAFAAAFKRRHRAAPGRWRAAHRTAEPTRPPLEATAG
jgi:AraC-like DNA-binding protein